jgi:hypothetical protein
MQEAAHSFDAKFSTEAESGSESCQYCHQTSTSIDNLIPPPSVPQGNYDGDAMTAPKAELAVFQARLLTAIQTYCRAQPNAVTAGYDYVAYNGAAYPYFVKDTNKNGVADVGEASSVKFDTKAFRASFNYNYSVKEPGCWAHNPKYVFQILYDSIENLGGNLSGLTRP